MPDGSELGASRRRVEDARFLRGEGRFLDDLRGPDELHAVVLRSPHAHARIAGIDAAAAAAVPGVRLVLTAAELQAEGLGDLPCVAQVPTVAPLIVPPRPALADGVVRHVGDPVAFVVADTPGQAQDGAEAIIVEYDAMPAVVDAEAALAPGAPLLWPQAPGNLCLTFRKGDRAAVDSAFARADTTVSLRVVNNRLVAAPLEPRAAVARFDPAAGSFLLEVTGQGVHGIRDQLATHVFRMAPDRIDVVSYDVGGGFGAKNFLYPEYVLALSAARRLGRPVRWTSGRTEDFLSSAQARDNLTVGRMALDKGGTILALDVSTVANLGAYLSPSGPGSSTNSPGTAMGGVYAIPAVHMEVRGAFTNTVPIDAYRGAGKPEANYVTERLVELAARQTGRDPATLRRQNLMRGFPHRTAMGMTVDCGDLEHQFDALLVAANRDGFPARRETAARRGVLRGFGVACFLETARGAPGEWAAVRFEPSGTVALAVGTQSNGQGHETSFPQLAADRLGLPHDRFRLVQADTRLVARGKGHGGARSLHMGGAALVEAMEMILVKARRLAAQLLQVEEAALRFGGGRFDVAEGTHGIGLLDVARAAADLGESLDTEVDSPLDLVTFPNGSHAAEVEVDPETGLVRLDRYTAVDDYGTLLNPLLTLGQVQGGLAQGIGQAMFEEVAYDPDGGQLLTASFQDYCIPRAADLPDLDIRFAGVPTASNPVGAKGAGQAGCIAAPQTVVHAVLDALAPLGITALDMPLTPLRVWQAMDAAARSRGIA